MSAENISIMVVDDEVLNLDLISEYLSEMKLNVVCIDSGDKALAALKDAPHQFSAVLLDRMMPGMDGIEVLKNIKSDKTISRLPVIMQTAKTGKQSMLEGLRAGAHYYLSKPYDQSTLIAIVSTAIKDYQSYLDLKESLAESAQTMQLMEQGSFTFKSLNEGRKLAAMLANACPDSERVVLGLTELITNAVEHGNLGITYEEKSRLNADGCWEDEITNRLASACYKDKYATIEFSRNEEEIMFVITDQGNGFDWHQYMEISPERAFDSHGRGIALANSVSFEQVDYQDNGNKVCVTVPLQRVQ